MKILGAAVLTSLVLLPIRAQPGLTAANDPKTETAVDVSGNLRVPSNYRTAYQSLGSWAVAADQSQGSKEIHASNDYQCLPGQAHWGTNRGQLELASAAIQRASYTEGAHVSTKSGSKC